MKILIADDDPISLRMLSKLVQGLGHDPVCFENGIRAYRHLREGSVRIAVLDWMMPGMTGPEICNRLRSENPSRILYIIIVTAMEGADEVSRALEKGASDYVTKPFERSELKARIGVGVRTVSLEMQLEELNRRLARLARTDSLTGLLNHAAILGELREQLESAGTGNPPTSVLMFDLDRFKKINDSFGHQAGDKILVRLAEALLRACRENDSVGRYGGEEFLMILPRTGSEEALEMGDRIRLGIQEMDHGDLDEELTTTVSVGVATSKSSSPASENLVSRADSALYKAKQDGRNLVRLDGGG
ncbi:diguanylate cyclase [Candidatus Fermentibacteria bacterium]|nr:diguanylate cyclase [Candidatus Fermentibacteria bacterium]